MDCYRVHIPIGTRVAGTVASGHRTCVLPGEYVAHRLPAKLTQGSAVLLRFVGADPNGRDVHVCLSVLHQLASTQGVTVSLLEESAEFSESA